MAPNRSGGGSSSREPSQKEKDWARWRSVMAFYPPGMNLEGTTRVARMAATNFNENGATVCQPATITSQDPRDARLFMCFVAAGLVPPASLFFLSVVASFGLHVTHLKIGRAHV